MVRTSLVVGVVALAGLSLWAWLTYAGAGETTTLIERFDGDCIADPALSGVEDIAVDWQANQVLLAGPAGLRMMTLTMDEDGPARFDFVGLSVGGAEVFERTTLRHAVDLVVDDNAGRTAFHAYVQDGDLQVNRWRLREAIEESFAEPFATIENISATDFIAIAAIDADTVYLTVARNPARGLWSAMRGRLSARNGELLEITTQGVRSISTDLKTPAGLAYDSTNATLYVSEVGHRGFSIWQRQDGGLERTARDRYGNAFARMTLDPERRLWVVGHPHTLTWLSNAHPSPTQVAFIDLDQNVGDQVFLSRGEPVSAANAALVRPEIGVMFLFGPNAGAACSLPEEWRHSQAYPAQRPRDRDGG